jgi:hypothetical protein
MKKIFPALIAILVVAGGVAAMSAYEAHIVNVTAHIENALSVSEDELAYGTVFPQEYLEKDFTISLSESFMAEENADDVNYIIAHKPKPGFENVLCPFLSTESADKDKNDTDKPSYYRGDHCEMDTATSTGRLAKSENDTEDRWVVNLKVPPIDGSVGQDWPEDCPTVPEEADYGCDLWIEVTDISRVNSSSTHPE